MEHQTIGRSIIIIKILTAAGDQHDGHKGAAEHVYQRLRFLFHLMVILFAGKDMTSGGKVCQLSAILCQLSAKPCKMGFSELSDNKKTNPRQPVDIQMVSSYSVHETAY